MLGLNVRNLLLATVICICGISCVVSYPRRSVTSSSQRRTGMWYQPVSRKLERFTFDLYRHISEGLEVDENMVFSPVSIYSALSLLGQGADGETRGQIKHVLHTPNFVDVQGFIKSTFRRHPDVTTSIAQRIFLDNSTLLKKDFKDFLNETGLHGVKKLDFVSDPEFCRQKINSWVSHNTMNEIEELLEDGQVTEMTRLYIVNALAMEAPWIEPFEKTKQQQFQISQDESIEMEMMTGSTINCMFTNTGWRAGSGRGDSPERYLTDTTVLYLPFKGRKLTFIAVMPNSPGNFTELESKSGEKKLLHTIRKLYGNNYDMLQHCDVTMPQYQLDYNYQDLKLDLIDMGVEDVFDAGMSDLSKLTRAGDELHVTDVAHKATFSLDKNGVKATAATALGISFRSFPPSITIDKPFLFFVKNVETEALLFMGKVVNPTAS